MNNKQNPHLTGIAQHLRKNMTPEERHLWFDFLKGLPITFNRQKVIGNFVVDFYSAEARIVIEIDGSQHLYGEGKEKDIERDTLLKELGIIFYDIPILIFMTIFAEYAPIYLST